MSMAWVDLEGTANELYQSLYNSFIYYFLQLPQILLNLLNLQ